MVDLSAVRMRERDLIAEAFARHAADFEAAESGPADPARGPRLARVLLLARWTSWREKLLARLDSSYDHDEARERLLAPVKALLGRLLDDARGWIEVPLLAVLDLERDLDPRARLRPSAQPLAGWLPEARSGLEPLMAFLGGLDPRDTWLADDWRHRYWQCNAWS